MAETFKYKDVQALNAPALSWRYVVSLPYLVDTNPIALNNNYLSSTLNPSSIGDIITSATSLVSDVQNFIPSKPVDVFITGIDLPQIGISSTSRYYSGRSINFPGRLSVENFNMSFYEDENYTVTKYLQTWMNNVCNSMGNYGIPDGLLGYKKRLIVSAFDTTGKETGTWELRGVYPEKPSGYEYSSENNDRLKVGCSFSCDYVNFLGKLGSLFSSIPGI